MEWKLELVPIPVSDVDRAKAFYTEKMGFEEDLDHSTGEAFRVVQLTPPGAACPTAGGRGAAGRGAGGAVRVVQLAPPGSACSIAVGTGIVDTSPGSVQGLQLVVPDIDAARAELLERGAGGSGDRDRER